MAKMDFTARWVLVTGASSGLGHEMALHLARDHKANLILVARRVDRLEALRRRLEADHGVQCRVVAADLSVPADVERVYAESVAAGDVYGVVLNAGVTYFGPHREIDWAAFEAMLATNVTSVVRLATLFAPYLAGKGQGGGILLVSSMAGFFPVPYQAAYSGTKGFVTHFGEGLHHELREHGVSVTVFSPGGIVTEMTQLAGLSATFDDTIFMLTADRCAREAVAAFKSRSYVYVPGFLNRAQLFFSRFIPRKLLTTIGAATFRKALPHRTSKPAPPASV